MDKLAVIQSEETVKELNLIDERVKGLVVTFKELVETGNKINSGLLKGTPKEFIQSEKELVELNKKKTQILKELAIAEQKIASINITNERARKEAANADKAELLLKQKQIQISAQQEKAVNQIVSAYDQLNKKHIEARKTAMDMGVQYGIVSKEFMDAAKVANQYDKQLKAIDSSLGKHNRNVGNYNNLQMQMSQVMREAPNFAIDPRIGIMSLTNNLPMLAEAIGDVATKNKELKKEFIESATAAKNKAIADAIATGESQKAANALGKQAEAQVMANYQAQKAPSLLKQLASSLFSWQMLLIAGISLLMIYNKEIIDWTAKLFGGSRAIDKVKESQKSLTEAFKASEFKKAIRDVSEMTNVFQLAKDGVVSKEKALKFYNETLGKVMGSATSLNEAEMILTKNADNYIKATLYKAAANLALDKSAAEMLKAEETRQKKIEEFKNSAIDMRLGGGSMGMGGGSFNAAEYDAETKRIKIAQEKRKKEEIKILEDRAKAQEIIAKNLMATSANFAKGMNFDSLFGKEDKVKAPKKDKVGPSISREERDAIDLAMADRDNQIARIKEQKLKMEINEKEYWQRYIQIQISYRDRILKILNDDNARKKRISAQAKLKAISEVEKANKEIFDYEKAGLDAQFKLQQQHLENRMESIKNDEYLMEVERIKQQNDVYNEMIANTDLYYQNIIESAKKNSQEIINIEAERDAKVADIQKDQMGLNAKMPTAIKTDDEYRTQIEDLYRSAADAEERRAIIANSRLSASDKEFALQMAEYDQSLKQLEIDKERNQQEQNKLLAKALTVKLTLKETEELAKLVEQASLLNEKFAETEESKRKLKVDKIASDWGDTVDFISGSLSDLGFTNFADQLRNNFAEMIQDLKDGTADWKDYTVLAAAAVTDSLNLLNQSTLDNRIAALDEQLAYTQATTEQELEFIDGRLEHLNALDELSKEQMAERNALEDEARVVKEQQLQREKMIEAQKARAQQKASANQALINGFLAATKTLANLGIPAGIVPAAVAASFGALQAAFIMSKNPVPQYFVGRKGGAEEIAWTQEKGRELITNNGKIKSFGSDDGAVLTKLDAGDTVHTAKETEEILSKLEGSPKLGDHVFRKIAKQSISPIFIQNETLDYDKLADKIGDKFERGLKKYDKTAYFEDENGNIFSQQGGNIPVFRGKKKKTNTTIIITKNERN